MRLSLRFLILGATFVAGPLAGERLEVRGRALTPDGRPAKARAELRPLASERDRGRAELGGGAATPPLAQADTDAEGGFLLTAPAPGLWRVTVRAAGHVPVELPALPVVEAGRSARGASRARPRAASVGPRRGRRAARRGVGGGHAGRSGPLPGQRRLAASAASRGHRRARGSRRSRADRRRSSKCGPSRPATPRERRRHGRRRPSRVGPRPGRRRADSRPPGKAARRRPRPGRQGPLAAGPDRTRRRASPRPASTGLPAGGAHRRGRDGGQPGRPRRARARPPALSAPAPVAIAGRVDRRPHPTATVGALVWRDAEPAHARVTAGDGTYRLTLSPRAAGWAHALAPGYVPELDSAGATSVDRSYVFALEPAARLTGKVVDESGAPVAGAEIVALADTQRSPRRRLGLAPPLAHARSRADGGFGLGRLALGHGLRLAHRAAGLRAARARAGPAQRLTAGGPSGVDARRRGHGASAERRPTPGAGRGGQSHSDRARLQRFIDSVTARSRGHGRARRASRVPALAPGLYKLRSRRAGSPPSSCLARGSLRREARRIWER